MLSLGICIFILNVYLGAFTIYKRRTLEAFVFGGFAIGFGIWALSIPATLSSGSLFWGRTAFLGAIIGIGSLFLFSQIFPDNKKISLSTYLVIATPVLLLVSICYTPLMIRTVSVIDGSIQGTFGPLMFIYKVYAPLYIFGSIYYIFSQYKKTRGALGRIRMRYAFLGITLFVVPAVLTNAVLPQWFHISSLNNIGPFFSLFMIGFISYAIIRHELLDIKVVLQRGLIFTSLFVSIVSVYLGLLFISGYLFNKTNSENMLLVALITTIVGIFGVPPLKLFFEKVTDPIFFKHKYNYAHVLGLLTDALSETILLESMVKRSTAILQQHLKLDTVSFMFGKGSTTEEQKLMRFPIISNRKHIGHLLVGEKLSGDSYTEEDKKLLETFAKQAGTALEKASLYKQVKEYATTLEEKVRERTQELTTIQKEQESLMLELSHGLQTPLTIMKGELFFLKKQGVNPENLKTLDSSIDRVSAFIYRLLNISQLETSLGKERTELNLSEILMSLVGFFQEEAKRRGITLHASIQDGIYTHGNEEELRELFSNLISNAIKYMRNSGIKVITISAKMHDTMSIIQVKDSGVGIRSEDIPNLFKKFYRVKNDETKGIQGTGLGLAVCKKIAELHGGNISVDSVFGEGTTFTVKLSTIKK